MDFRRPELNFGAHGYELVAYYGGGMYGRAYLVRKIDTNEIRIAKTVDLTEMLQSSRDAAIQEAHLLLGFTHPHIVPCYEAYVQDDSYLVMIMEYCQGGDLARCLAAMRMANKQFDEPEIRTMLFQLLSALAFIHENRILHRDLKPSNILISKTGELKVADFGVARILTGVTCAALTSAGTPNYMAPEMCKRKPYSFYSDMWSLGCVLYEIMTLTTAFQGESIIALAWSVCFENPNPIRGRYSRVLEKILMMLLSKEPDQRLLPKTLLHHEYFLATTDVLRLPKKESSVKDDEDEEDSDDGLKLPSLKQGQDDGHNDLRPRRGRLLASLSDCPEEDEDDSNEPACNSGTEDLDVGVLTVKLSFALWCRQRPFFLLCLYNHPMWRLVKHHLEKANLIAAGVPAEFAELVLEYAALDNGDDRLILPEQLQSVERQSGALERGQLDWTLPETNGGFALSRHQSATGMRPSTAPGSTSAKFRHSHVVELLNQILDKELSDEWVIEILSKSLATQISIGEYWLIKSYFENAMGREYNTVRDLVSLGFWVPPAFSELLEKLPEFDHNEIIVKLRWAVNQVLKDGHVLGKGSLKAANALVGPNGPSDVDKQHFLDVMRARFVSYAEPSACAREMYAVANKNPGGSVDWQSTVAFLLEFARFDGDPDKNQESVINNSLGCSPQASTAPSSPCEALSPSLLPSPHVRITPLGHPPPMTPADPLEEIDIDDSVSRGGNTPSDQPQYKEGEAETADDLSLYYGVYPPLTLVGDGLPTNARREPPDALPVTRVRSCDFSTPSFSKQKPGAQQLNECSNGSSLLFADPARLASLERYNRVGSLELQMRDRERLAISSNERSVPSVVLNERGSNERITEHLKHRRGTADGGLLLGSLKHGLPHNLEPLMEEPLRVSRTASTYACGGDFMDYPHDRFGRESLRSNHPATIQSAYDDYAAPRYSVGGRRNSKRSNRDSDNGRMESGMERHESASRHYIDGDVWQPRFAALSHELETLQDARPIRKSYYEDDYRRKLYDQAETRRRVHDTAPSADEMARHLENRRDEELRRLLDLKRSRETSPVEEDLRRLIEGRRPSPADEDLRRLLGVRDTSPSEDEVRRQLRQTQSSSTGDDDWRRGRETSPTEEELRRLLEGIRELSPKEEEIRKQQPHTYGRLPSRDEWDYYHAEMVVHTSPDQLRPRRNSIRVRRDDGLPPLAASSSAASYRDAPPRGHRASDANLSWMMRASKSLNQRSGNGRSGRRQTLVSNSSSGVRLESLVRHIAADAEDYSSSGYSPVSSYSDERRILRAGKSLPQQRFASMYSDSNGNDASSSTSDSWEIPPDVDRQRVSETSPVESQRIYVVQEAQEWPQACGRRRPHASCPKVLREVTAREIQRCEPWEGFPQLYQVIFELPRETNHLDDNEVTRFTGLIIEFLVILEAFLARLRYMLACYMGVETPDFNSSLEDVRARLLTLSRKCVATSNSNRERCYYMSQCVGIAMDYLELLVSSCNVSRFMCSPEAVVKLAERILLLGVGVLGGNPGYALSPMACERLSREYQKRLRSLQEVGTPIGPAQYQAVMAVLNPAPALAQMLEDKDSSSNSSCENLIAAPARPRKQSVKHRNSVDAVDLAKWARQKNRHPSFMQNI